MTSKLERLIHQQCISTSICLLLTALTESTQIEIYERQLLSYHNYDTTISIF